MQTAIYVRISQDQKRDDQDQEERGKGVARQREDCEALAAQLGWTVYDTYEDNDVSATSGKPREHYERMLDDIKAGKVGAIIAWHTDRLYRRIRDLEPLIDLLEEHGVEIRTVRSGQFDLANPTGRGIARILASTAQMEVEIKADRWGRSVRQSRKAGKMPRLSGAVTRMYGWTADGEVVDDEAEILRNVAERIKAGATIPQMCRDLNDRGIVTATGKAWRTQTLRGLMLNPRLAGHSTLGGEIMGKSTWPAILTDDDWLTVKALLTAHSRTVPPRVSLLPGLIFCGRCEEKMVTGGKPSGGRYIRYYVCQKRPGWLNCGKVAAAAVPVEEVAEGVARQYLSKPKVRRAIASAQSGGLTHIFAELEAQERQRDELKDSLADPAHRRHQPELLHALDVVKDRIEDLTGRLSVSAPARIPDDVWKDWPTDLGHRRRLVEFIVARVWVDPAPVRGGRFDPARVRVDPTDVVGEAG